MEAPRAPAPRLRPSPISTDASTSSHQTLPASLIGSPRPILNLLRPSVIQSPSEFIFSPPALPLVSRTNDGTPRSRSQKYTELASLLSGNMSQTPTSDEAYQSKQSTSSDRLPQFSQTRISGEVALTPTYSSYAPSHSSGIVQNPHSTMIAQTPVAANLAKNSIKLQNCVSTVNLKCELKLLDIYCRTRFSEYNPSRFHGVVMKILEPRATALVFRSGKLVCTGARNEHDSLLATKKFSRVIQKLGFPVKFTEFKIQNLVATADLRFPIKLEALQQAHGQFTSYEPELFPGLIYRMIRPRIVLLIFVNGKIVFTGGKSREDISESLNIIYPILKSFKKN